MMNEVAQARMTLVDTERRRCYNEKLAADQGRSLPLAGFSATCTSRPDAVACIQASRTTEVLPGQLGPVHCRDNSEYELAQAVETPPPMKVLVGTPRKPSEETCSPAPWTVRIPRLPGWAVIYLVLVGMSAVGVMIGKQMVSSGSRTRDELAKQIDTRRPTVPSGTPLNRLSSDRNVTQPLTIRPTREPPGLRTRRVTPLTPGIQPSSTAEAPLKPSSDIVDRAKPVSRLASTLSAVNMEAFVPRDFLIAMHCSWRSDSPLVNQVAAWHDMADSIVGQIRVGANNRSRNTWGSGSRGIGAVSIRAIWIYDGHAVIRIMSISQDIDSSGYVAARDAAEAGSHEGIKIYRVRITGEFLTLPHPRLIVSSSTLDGLKAAMDRASTSKDSVLPMDLASSACAIRVRDFARLTLAGVLPTQGLARPLRSLPTIMWPTPVRSLTVSFDSYGNTPVKLTLGMNAEGAESPEQIAERWKIWSRNLRARMSRLQRVGRCLPGSADEQILQGFSSVQCNATHDGVESHVLMNEQGWAALADSNRIVLLAPAPSATSVSQMLKAMQSFSRTRIVSATGKSRTTGGSVRTSMSPQGQGYVDETRAVSEIFSSFDSFADGLVATADRYASSYDTVTIVPTDHPAWAVVKQAILVEPLTQEERGYLAQSDSDPVFLSLVGKGWRKTKPLTWCAYDGIEFGVSSDEVIALRVPCQRCAEIFADTNVGKVGRTPPRSITPQKSARGSRIH